MSRQAVVQAPVQASSAARQASGGILQRTCACGRPTVAGGECAECQRKRQAVLRRAFETRSPVSQVPRAVYDVIRSSGHPLDASTYAEMGRSFGHDFSQIRLHTDARAAESARAVDAHAYALGRHIVFGAGRYAPHTRSGQRLLAHELTHAIQQRGVAEDPPMQLRVGGTRDAAEVEADAVADHIVTGRAVPVITATPTAAARRLKGDDEGPEATAAEKPISRPEEIRLSRTTTGGVAATARPPVISLYNFAIDSTDLKKEHQSAPTSSPATAYNALNARRTVR